MMNLFIKLVVMKFSGIKMYMGGIGLMLSGLVMVLTGTMGIIGKYFPDANLPAVEVETAWKQMVEGFGLISLGFGGIGLGHKLEKQNK